MKKNSIFYLVGSLASLIIIIMGLKLFAEILSPVLLSLFIVLVCSPFVEWMRSRKVPLWLARTIVVLGVVAIGLILVGFLAASITQLTEVLPSYRSLLENQFNTLEKWLNSQGIQAHDIFQLDFLSPQRLVQVVLEFLGGLLGTLGNIVVTLFVFIYMLIGSRSFSKKLARRLGENNLLLIRIEEFSKSISVYLAIKSFLGALTALGHILLLWVMGVNFAVLWGVISFLMNFIPNVGFVISLIPPVLMSLLQFGLGKSILVAVGYILINNFFDVAIAPRYLGKGLDLSILVTFLAVIFWTWVLGAIGAFLALPLTVMLKKLVLESYAETQLLAELLAVEEDD